MASEHGEIAGFWPGLWQGFIAPFVFVVSLFKGDLNVYEVHNNCDRSVIRNRRVGRCAGMQILRLADGEERVVLSLHGVWQHKWLLVMRGGKTPSRNGRYLWKPLRFGRATDRERVRNSKVWEPRSCARPGAFSQW